MHKENNNKYNILTPQPAYLTSRKRFRGRKRYYRKLNREIDSWLNSLTDADFNKPWHIHVDFYGYGNLGGRHRLSHLAVFCRIFCQVAAKVNGRKDTQIVLQLNDKKDAALDTLYFNIIGALEGISYAPSSPQLQPCKDDFLNQYLQEKLAPYRIAVRSFENECGITYYVTPESGQ